MSPKGTATSEGLSASGAHTWELFRHLAMTNHCCKTAYPALPGQMRLESQEATCQEICVHKNHTLVKAHPPTALWQLQKYCKFHILRFQMSNLHAMSSPTLLNQQCCNAASDHPISINCVSCCNAFMALRKIVAVLHCNLRKAKNIFSVAMHQ